MDPTHRSTFSRSVFSRSAPAPRACTRRIRTRRLLQGTAVAAVAAVALAGCSSGGGGGSMSSGGVSSRPMMGAAQGEAADAMMRGRRSAGGAGTTAEQAAGLLSREVIQRAGLTVRARDVGTALAQARTIVLGAQGQVAQEHTTTNRRGEPRRSTLTLRVPVDAFDEVLAELGDLGRLGSQQVSTQDVSTEVVDVQARITSAERTIDRLRELLEAADDFSDVLSLEGELARREADLASLRAQQAYLEDQTSLSTIQLTLLPRRPGPDQPDEDAAGFVGGLAVGWDALVTLVTGLLTWFGVLLPLLVVLLPVGLLVWWVLRRLARRPGAPPAQAAQPPSA